MFAILDRSSKKIVATKPTLAEAKAFYLGFAAADQRMLRIVQHQAAHLALEGSCPTPFHADAEPAPRKLEGGRQAHESGYFDTEVGSTSDHPATRQRDTLTTATKHEQREKALISGYAGPTDRGLELGRTRVIPTETRYVLRLAEKKQSRYGVWYGMCDACKAAGRKRQFRKNEHYYLAITPTSEVDDTPEFLAMCVDCAADTTLVLEHENLDVFGLPHHEESNVVDAVEAELIGREQVDPGILRGVKGDYEPLIRRPQDYRDLISLVAFRGGPAVSTRKHKVDVASSQIDAEFLKPIKHDLLEPEIKLMSVRCQQAQFRGPCTVVERVADLRNVDNLLRVSAN